MSYRGRELTAGNYLKLDDLQSQFNSSTTTFNLTSGGTAFYPGSAFSIQVVLGGVIQEPESAYTINQSQITFASAPGSGDDFFCIALGVSLGIGVPGEGTVTGTKLSKPFSYDDGLLVLDSTNNFIGINSTVPTKALDVVGNVKVSGIVSASAFFGSGISTFQGGAVVGSATTFTEDLVVQGDARVTGILSIGTGTITLDPNDNSISIADVKIRRDHSSGDIRFLDTHGNLSNIIANTVRVGSGDSSVSLVTNNGKIVVVNNNGNVIADVGITSTTSINTTGIITASSLFGTQASFTGIVTGSQLVSTIATSTAPFIVASTTLVSNLNSQYLNGQLGSYYTTAGNLSGTIPSGVLGNSTHYIGTTAILLNRASASQSLTGITSIDGSSASVTNSVTFNNGGAGAASGTTFNGSAAQTISYNTLGASPLAGSSSLVTTGTVTSGTWSGSFGAVSGANLTGLTAGNLSGTIPSGVLGNSTVYIGTTAILLNRASASQSLTGINIDGSSGSCTGNAATATTASNVGNGTLTLAVSGTGLSGSASFTANQSGATTFTVTSNATSANTASAIVARDGSGDFSARYINSSYFNSTDDTSSTTLTYLIGKFGDNYHRSATAAKVATFISGQTMNINGSSTSCSGNAATATNVAYSGLTGTVPTWNQNTTGSSGSVTGLTLNSSAAAINPDNVTQNQIGYNTNISLYGQTDGGLYSSAYSSSWIHQIYGDFRTGQIAIRGKNSGTWQSWYYVPSYGYNGGAAISTSLYATIYYDSNNTGYYTDPASTSRLNVIYCGDVYNDLGGWFRNYGVTGLYNQSYGIHFYAGDANYWNVASNYGLKIRSAYESTIKGYVYFDSSGFGLLDSSGNWKVRTTTSLVEIYNRLDAPIMYDSNNTGYYTDPASTSNLNQINLQGVLRRNTSAAGYLEGNYPTGVDGNSSTAIYTIGGSYQPGGTGLGNMYGCGYTVGNGTANPGLGATGWGFYVASGGVSRIFLDSDSGYGIASGSWRAPLFYDSNNTAYYTDPASTSILNGLTTNSGLTVNNGWTYVANNYGYGIVGLYTSTIFQLVFAMGDSYKTTAGGGISNLYGIAWSHPNAGGIAGNLDSHGLIVAINGGFGSCMAYSIVASGNVTAYSDERLKRNWKNLPENFVELLSKVKSGSYDRIDGEQLRQVGASAQSLRSILPEAVIEADDEFKTLSISYGNAALVSAIELAKEIVDLKEQLNSQNTIIQSLINRLELLENK